MELVIRAVDPDTDPAVGEVVKTAFGGDEEYQLVADLRRDEGVWVPELSLGAYDGETLVGHILFTRASIGDAPAVLLAPLAVAPDWQKRGVGTALARAGLAASHALGVGLALVLGHPEYYPHFGFEPALPYGIEPPYPVEPAEAWMVAELTPGALDAASGPLGMSDVFLDPAMWRE